VNAAILVTHHHPAMNLIAKSSVSLRTFTQGGCRVRTKTVRSIQWIRYQNQNATSVGIRKPLIKRETFSVLADALARYASTAYRIGYWIIAIWMASGFYNISAANIRLYGVMAYVFSAIFFFGAVRALWIDSVIRKNIVSRSQ